MAKPAFSIRIQQELRESFIKRCRTEKLSPAHVMESLINAWMEGKLSFRPATVIVTPQPENTDA